MKTLQEVREGAVKTTILPPEVLSCYFYPPRPVNGGRLDLALPKNGVNWYEPKVNGWRALVHAPTGAMFNRLGERLTIESQFKRSLEIIKSICHSSRYTPDWFDVEALERRHNIGRGTLIVLDLCDPKRTYVERREIIDQFIIPLNGYGSGKPCLENEVRCLVPELDGMAMWNTLQQENARLGGTPQTWFYEGVVAKRAESLYPLQHRSPEIEFPYWVKHRYSF